MSELLAVNNIQCHYDDLCVIKDLSFTLSKGEIACLLGPSGCGKSTILRAIAGFEPLSQGLIRVNGIEISSPSSLVTPEKRKIGMVFQDYALFPHLTVTENIEFGLKYAKNSTKHTSKEMIDLVDLNGCESRYPHELSGGQQQRVALARALAPSPSLLLLDEPFSNLDTELRSRLSLDIRDILKKLGISAILVTHDQKEAFAMCDHIGVIDQGSIQQWGKPYELYHEPANRFVACFIGQGSFIKGYSVTHETFSSELGEIQGNRAYKYPKGTEVEILLRPDDIIYNAESTLEAIIATKTFAGTSTLYILQLNSGTTIEAIFPSHQDFSIGERITIDLEAEHLIAYSLNNK